MERRREAAYGSWVSPISSSLVTAGGVGLGQIQLDGAAVYWDEVRPTEGGRTVIMRWTPGGAPVAVTPPGFNARTRVHEYGGGSYTVVDGTIYFMNFGDQHLYVQRPGAEPEVLYAEQGARYADFVADRRHNRLICVRELHTDEAVVNTLVALPLDGSGSVVLAEGNDFYASARVSPDGQRLAWLTWNHPNMPWDGTELWVADLRADGAIERAACVAGGESESIFQPEWSPEGQLHFVSDRTGWWNLYRWDQGNAIPLRTMEAEFGEPEWIFGLSTYGFLADGRIACAYTGDGLWHLALMDPANKKKFRLLDVGCTDISDVKALGNQVLFVGGSAHRFPAIMQLDTATEACQVLRQASEVELDPGYLSKPEPVEFPTDGGVTAFGLFYEPENKDFTAPLDDRPPLIVISHGGPTAQASSSLKLGTQFWTSRGFAVLDVNYGGSSGYGRAYRERLNGQWGIVDVNDCVNGARYLAEKGRVDGNRMSIMGGSAGGYTTLAALTFHDVFRAGVSFFGVSDLESLAQDTHKFESRYLDRLVGPYPASRELYRSRSPIHFTDRLSCPVIFFQGLEDRVVPPNQAQKMVDAIRAKGLPVAYVPFEGEGHGFRRAENNKRALEAQLYFYARLYGLAVADALEPVVIDNL